MTKNGLFLRLETRHSFLDSGFLEFISGIGPRYLLGEDEYVYWNTRSSRPYSSFASAIIDFFFDYSGGLLCPDKWDDDLPIRQKVVDTTRELLKEALAKGWTTIIKKTKMPQYEASFRSSKEGPYVITQDGELFLGGWKVLYPGSILVELCSSNNLPMIKELVESLSMVADTECVFVQDNESKTILYHAFQEQYNRYINRPDNEIYLCFAAKTMMRELSSSSSCLGYRERLLGALSELGRTTLKDALNVFEILISTREYYSYPLHLGLLLFPDDFGGVESPEMFDLCACEDLKFEYNVIISKKDATEYATDGCFKLNVKRKPQWDNPKYGKAWLYYHNTLPDVWHILYAI